MNRRDFLTVMGGATAASLTMAKMPSLFAATGTTSLYVRGLVMFSAADPAVVRLGFPKAPGHKASLEVIPQAGDRHALNFKGVGALETNGVAFDQTIIKVPELVSMKEFYGSNYRSRIDQSPILINIPRNAIKSITTAAVSDDRYTFVRADNHLEVETFRPRQIADTLKIDLSSSAVLKLDNGKISIPLGEARELHMDYSPDADMARNDDMYAEHFHHYFAYMDRAASANFDVLPEKLGAKSSPTPHVGNHFAAFYPYSFCFAAEL